MTYLVINLIHIFYNKLLIIFIANCCTIQPEQDTSLFLRNAEVEHTYFSPVPAVLDQYIE